MSRADKILRNLVESMETPRTRKAAVAWDVATSYIHEFSPAGHIFDWARNSQDHNRKLVGLAAYPDTGNFATAKAGMAFALACETYRDMKRDRNGEDYSPEDILSAALLFLEWKPGE